jgi:Na+-driven multidrug efflux pump
MNYTPIMMLLLYVVLTHLIAQYLGAKRRIGYGRSVFWSVLFSPLIGLLVTLSSEKIEKL